MTRRIKLLLTALALTGLFCTPALADEIVSLKAGYLMLSPEGSFAVDGNGLTGTSVDLDKDLGFDDSENFTVEGALNLGPFRLSVGYLPLEFSGSGTMSQNVTFNGKTFNTSLTTTSEVKIDIVDAALTWHIINLDDLPARIQFGPEIAVKYIDADLTMTGVDTSVPPVSITENDSVQVPVPTVGARARIAISDYLGVIGRLGYMEYNSNSFLDAEAQIEFSPVPLVGVYGGYRYFDLQVDDSGVFVDAQFSGPFVGALVRF